MPISVTCPNNHKLNVSETLSGKKVKCPKCGGVVMVGALSEVPSPTTPNRSTTPAAQLNQTKPTTPAPLPLDPFPDSIDPLSAPFPDVPAFPSPAAVQPTSSRSSTQPIKTKAQPKGHIWDSLLLSLAVSLGLFFGIVSGGSLWAMFMLDFSNGKATAARGSNGLIEPRDNPNSNQAANVKPQTLNPQASNTQASKKSDLDSLPEAQKKKINVFGYDINQRTALADYLSKENVSKIKANASVLIVAGKLLNAAKSMELTPDENNAIAFPSGTNFERMFNDETLIEAVDTATLPEVFVPLIAKYSKGEAAPDEKKLAYYVLAAFYLSEVK